MTTNNSREVEETKEIIRQQVFIRPSSLDDAKKIWAIAEEAFDNCLHQELQKAREEERERIEAIFKEHVPPHAMDLEDSVWLKRLLNKAFGHENIY